MAENPIKNVADRLTAEDIVIIIAIVLTLLLAPFLTFLWFLETPILIPPPVIAIFLGIAVSALLYRFLGGVHDASFTVGALKVTGTAAILIGVAWWSNGELKNSLPKVKSKYPPFDIKHDVVPNYKSWYAVNIDTGKPVSLDFPKHNQKQNLPSIEVLNDIRLNQKLELKVKEGAIAVIQKNNHKSILGVIDKNDLSEIGYHNEMKVDLKPYRVATFKASQSIDINTNLPFTVETNGFSENYTRFILRSKNDQSIVYEDSIQLRGAKLFKHESKFYLISVVQVNHAPDNVDPYAKIYIAEIVVNYV